MSNICIIGDILVDISLKSQEDPLKMRLGGIVHAARCLWALGLDYSVGYFAPSYLDSHIEEYLMSRMGCGGLCKLGEVMDSPYTMLINEVKEVGDQGYEFILRDQITIVYKEEAFKELMQHDDIFLIYGNYDFRKVITSLPMGARIHCDIANNMVDLDNLRIGRQFETLFISTSSSFFQKQFSKIDSFLTFFEPYTENLILKENRGGSRAYNYNNKDLISIPAQTQKITHSVGVGDVYDVAYVALKTQMPFSDALYYSSWIATEYAKTTFPNDFQKMVRRVLKISIEDLISLGGCHLPWEERPICNIYIAAPDFDFVDVRPVDILVNSLSYHNFSSHRPIQENGQMSSDATFDEKQSLFMKDMYLLEKCDMLIAVLLYNDPGTLIEIGIAAERKIPTIVYDPYKIAKNCMLTQLPKLVSSDLDEIMSQVFLSFSN